MCGVIFGMDCARKVTKNLNWTITIPEKKYYNHHHHHHHHRYSSNNVKRTDNNLMSNTDTGIENNEFIDYKDSSSSSSSSSSSPSSSLSSSLSSAYKSLSKLVQITDIHVDPYYEPGSEASCGEPLCCRSTNGQAKNKDRSAGIWGDYRNCDTPVQTLRHVLKHINEMHSDVCIYLLIDFFIIQIDIRFNFFFNFIPRDTEYRPNIGFGQVMLHHMIYGM